MERCGAIEKRNLNIPYSDILLSYIRDKLDLSAPEQKISLSGVDMYAYSVIPKVINSPDIKGAYSCISFELECKDIHNMVDYLNHGVSTLKPVFKVYDNSNILVDTGLFMEFLFNVALSID